MKISLKYKVICIVLIVAVVLSSAALIVSYTVYANTMDDHYRTLTQNLSKTAAEMVDKQEITELTNKVMNTYYKACDGNTAPDFDNFSDEDWEEYYSLFADAAQSRDFSSVFDTLAEIKESNNVLWMYVCFMDEKTNKAVYIVDSDDSEEGCPPGYCDPIEAGNLELMKSGDYDFPAYITDYDEYGWLCTASTAIKDAHGKVIANAYVDISMESVMNDRHDFLLKLILILLAATLILILLIIWIIRLTIVKPINTLATATGKFISEKQENSGDSAISRLNIKTGDEIENLSDSIKKMEIEINTYIDNLSAVTAEKERIGAELNVATQIQASMLPSTFPAFPERAEFDIYASMHPAKEVGGDFYDFFFVDDDHFAMVMADVSGKGVPAALFMVIAKTLIKNCSQAMASPKDILEKVNTQLCENNEAEMFVTVWLGILTISTGKLRAANAGHEFPVIKKAGGDFELIKDKHGFVLAGMDCAKYTEYELTIEKGDKLYLYTDGVCESTNAGNELFGTDRMLKALNDNADKSPKELLVAVRESIDRFVLDAPQFDDITMMGFEMKAITDCPKKTLTSKTADLPTESVLRFVEGVLEEKGVNQSVVTKMNVAVDEIYSNILLYSGADDVEICVNVSDDEVSLSFSDNGVAYNPLEKPDPDITLSVEERQIGGLGIFMVKKSMDSMEYAFENGRNILTIRKNLS